LVSYHGPVGIVQTKILPHFFQTRIGWGSSWVRFYSKFWFLKVAMSDSWSFASILSFNQISCFGGIASWDWNKWLFCRKGLRLLWKSRQIYLLRKLITSPCLRRLKKCYGYQIFAEIGYTKRSLLFYSKRKVGQLNPYFVTESQ